MKCYQVDDENNLPEGLIKAIETGCKIYCESAIGPLLLDEPEFRNGLKYYTEETK